jgi:hypothetical protein
LHSNAFILPLSAKIKDYRNLIEQELTRINFTSQLHNNYVNPDGTKHCLIKGIASQGQSEKSFSAKTGSHHLSSVIGCCSSTSYRRLGDWAEKGLIVRKIMHEDTNNLNQFNLPTTLRKYRAIIRNAKSMCLGSLITNFSKLGSYIPKCVRKSKLAFEIFMLSQQGNNNTNTTWARV